MHSTDNLGPQQFDDLMEAIEDGDIICKSGIDALNSLGYVADPNEILVKAVEAQQLLLEHFNNKYGEVPQRIRTRNAQRT